MRNFEQKFDLGNGVRVDASRVELTPTLELARRQKLSLNWCDVSELSTREPWHAGGLWPQIKAVNKVHGVGPASKVGCLIRGLIGDVFLLAGAVPGVIRHVNDEQRGEAANRILTFRQRVLSEVNSRGCDAAELALKLPQPKRWKGRAGFLGRPLREDEAMMEAAFCAHGAVTLILYQCRMELQNLSSLEMRVQHSRAVLRVLPFAVA